MVGPSSGSCRGTWGGLGIVSVALTLGILMGVLGLPWLRASWSTQQLGWQAAGHHAATDALELARRRLASGDITATEFEEIRLQLGR